MIFIVFALVFYLGLTREIKIDFVPSSKTPPSPRILPVMDYNPQSNSLYIFGGYANGEYLNDFWTFDLENQLWTRYVPLGSKFPGKV